VSSQVVAEVSMRCETYSTLFAFKWLLATVNSTVSFKIALFGEAFIADITFKRLYSLVGAQVNL
jgi:hypothetical protein